MSKRLLAAVTLTAAVALSGCMTNRYGYVPGHETQFAKPANLGPKIELTKEMVAGNEYTFTDEIDTYWVRLGASGVATAGKGADTKEPGAAWRIQDGNICLKGTKWWTSKGNCYQFFGGAGQSTKDATVMSPTYKRGPNSWYPARFAR
jgi:hypothetical protein